MPLTALRPGSELLGIVAALGGRWHGYHAMCCCPSHDDRTPSLSLRQGDRGILVTCFAGCDSTDVLRALRRLDPVRHAAPPPTSHRPAGSAVRRLWDAGLPVVGTPAADYLGRRGLVLPLRDIRFAPNCPLGPKPRTRFLPALLVAVRVGDRLVAVQRIFLDRPWAPGPKLMLGTPETAAWRGAEAGEVIAIAEGFETAAAYAQLHGVPAWSSLGGRRLDRLVLPTTLTRLVIAEDRDLEGEAAGARAMIAYARPGLDIIRHPPPSPFDDWAAVLEAQVKRGGGSMG